MNQVTKFDCLESQPAAAGVVPAIRPQPEVVPDQRRPAEDSTMEISMRTPLINALILALTITTGTAVQHAVAAPSPVTSTAADGRTDPFSTSTSWQFVSHMR